MNACDRSNHGLSLPTRAARSSRRRITSPSAGGRRRRDRFECRVQLAVGAPLEDPITASARSVVETFRSSPDSMPSDAIRSIASRTALEHGTSNGGAPSGGPGRRRAPRGQPTRSLRTARRRPRTGRESVARRTGARQRPVHRRDNLRFRLRRMARSRPLAAKVVIEGRLGDAASSATS